MKFLRALYFIGGIILTGLIVLSAIAIFNVIIFKIPICGSQMQTPLPELNTVSLPAQFNEISSDDPIRETLLTEDNAWAHAWTFLDNRVGFKLFLPMEKSTVGLNEITDNKGARYLVWEFSVKQKERPYLIFERRTLGGEIYIDARDGHILWYAGFS